MGFLPSHLRNSRTSPAIPFGSSSVQHDLGVFLRIAIFVFNGNPVFFVNKNGILLYLAFQLRR